MSMQADGGDDVAVGFAAWARRSRPIHVRLRVREAASVPSVN
jgi:hypothetical protein